MNTSFERADDGGTQVWLTPLPLLRALGPFDLDPCACAEPRPWPTAALHYGGLHQTNPFHGLVNPSSDST